MSDILDKKTETGCKYIEELNLEIEKIFDEFRCKARKLIEEGNNSLEVKTAIGIVTAEAVMAKATYYLKVNDARYEFSKMRETLLSDEHIAAWLSKE